MSITLPGDRLPVCLCACRPLIWFRPAACGGQRSSSADGSSSLGSSPPVARMRLSHE